MTSEMRLSAEGIAWLEELVRRDGWVSANDLRPPETFRALIWLGLVEQDDVSFRASSEAVPALAFNIVNADEEI
jgi:hypothetical protein